MWRRARWSLAVLALAAMSVGACSPSSSGGSKEQAVVVEKNQTSGLSKLALSEKAAARLGIATVAVASGGASNQTVVPYSAVIYDAQGHTWAYTNTETRTYVRHEITIDRIDGDRAILSAGPAVGTGVVTVGAAELWGVETGVGGGH